MKIDKMAAIREVNLSVSDGRVWNVWLLVLLVFASHGLLLINDGVYWDGWQLYGYYLNQDSESLLGIFSDAGYPLTGYFHWVFWSAPNMIFAYKLVSFISILLSTVLVYLISQRIKILTPLERWFVAAIVCCYPAFQAQVEIIITPSLVTYTLFWLGVYISLRCFEITGRNKIPLRFLGLAIIGFSFRYSALLVFYFPLLILFLAGRQSEWSGKNLLRKFMAVSKYSDFILLPFAYWMIDRMFWKRQNEYAEYNQLIFDPKQWALDFWRSINNSIIEQFHHAFTLAGNRPLLAISLLALAAGIVMIISAKQEQTI